MSRPIIYMAAFGLIALIAVTFAFLRGGPSLEPSGGNGRLPGLPVKPIGNTAISHGGPTPARAEGDSPPQAAAPIALGDRVVVGAVPRPGGGPPAPVALLAAVPESEPPELPASTETVTSVLPGAAAIVVAIAPAVPPDTRQNETYYKVQLSNGLAGWVPERSLHLAAHPAGEEAPR
jgi:hypothetical protein